LLYTRKSLNHSNQASSKLQPCKKRHTESPLDCQAGHAASRHKKVPPPLTLSAGYATDGITLKQVLAPGAVAEQMCCMPNSLEAKTVRANESKSKRQPHLPFCMREKPKRQAYQTHGLYQTRV
jgi:hypothetical protein